MNLALIGAVGCRAFDPVFEAGVDRFAGRRDRGRGCQARAFWWSAVFDRLIANEASRCSRARGSTVSTSHVRCCPTNRCAPRLRMLVFDCAGQVELTSCSRRAAPACPPSRGGDRCSVTRDLELPAGAVESVVCTPRTDRGSRAWRSRRVTSVNVVPKRLLRICARDPPPGDDCSRRLAGGAATARARRPRGHREIAKRRARIRSQNGSGILDSETWTWRAPLHVAEGVDDTASRAPRLAGDQRGQRGAATTKPSQTRTIQPGLEPAVRSLEHGMGAA